MTFLYVAIGGALGAVARYSISLLPLKTTFPFLTLITNLLGAIIIGIVVGIADKNENFQFTALLKTGFCGGFTTFSTFSLETVNLFENQHYFLAVLYAFISCMLCFLGVALGKMLANSLYA